MTRRTSIIGFALLGLLGGCGLASSVNGPPRPVEPTPTPPPQVESVSPDPGEINVERNVSITIQFSEAMDPSTVNLSNIQVEENAPLAGTLSYDADKKKATFTPDQRLALLWPYRVTLKAGLKTSEGNALPEDYYWTFTTRDGQWSTSSGAIATVRDSSSMTIEGAINSKGDAVLAWKSGSVFRAAISHSASSWTIEQTFPSSGQYDRPHVSISDSGNAMVSWAMDKDSATSWGSLYRIYDSSTDSWGNSYALDATLAQHARYVQSGMSADGKAIFVWREDDLSVPGAGLYARALGSNLTPAEGPLQKPSVAPTCCDLSLAVSWLEGAFAIFRQPGTTLQEVAVTRYTPSGGWGAPAALGQGNVLSPVVATNGAGDAMALWLKLESTGNQKVKSSFFDSEAEVWDPAEVPVENFIGVASVAQVGIDSDGNAIAVWNKVNGTDYQLLASRRSRGAASWGTAETLDSGEVTSKDTAVRVAVDPFGRAYAGFSEAPSGGRNRIYVRRYYPTPAPGSWSSRELIASDSLQDLTEPQISMSPRGDILLLWLGTGNDRQIFVSRFE